MTKLRQKSLERKNIKVKNEETIFALWYEYDDREKRQVTKTCEKRYDKEKCDCAEWVRDDWERKCDDWQKWNWSVCMIGKQQENETYDSMRV